MWKKTIQHLRTAFNLFLPMSTSYFHGVILCIVVFTDLLGTQGGIVCHSCNSKEGYCSTHSLQDTRQSPCTRGYDYCALYRMVFPNGTTAQIVRGCDRDCKAPVTKWTLGKYQKTTYCKMCCDSDFCNNQLKDPCSKSNLLSSLVLLIFAIVSTGLIANYHVL